MNSFPFCPVPAAKSQFMPRSHGGHFWRVIENAWSAEGERVGLDEKRAAAGEAVAAHLESRATAEDLAVLRRHGFAETMTSIYVRVFVPESQRWEATFKVDLPRAVEVPKGTEVACGPRYSDQADRGINAKYRAELESEGKFAEFCIDQAARETHVLRSDPADYFATLLVLRRVARDATDRATKWPEAQRAESGKWPTWAAIEAEFPFVARYMAAVRAHEAQREAERQARLAA